MYPSENNYPKPDLDDVIRDHLAWLERQAEQLAFQRSYTRSYAYRAAAADLRGRLA